MADSRDVTGRKLNSMRKEINILLIGESGVGKSTFINSFVCYLTNEKLEELKSNFNPLIRIPIALNDDSILDNIDENETGSIGQSSTKQCKSYEIEFGNNQVIRLIDTPGIGDRRGVEQDQQNWNDILLTINQFEELHAICIFLLPNNTRLNTSFQYCFKQLLLNFDKSITKNIIFIYTKGRSFQYNPDKTKTSKILKQFFKDITYSSVTIPYDENVFCVDNESIPYAVQNTLEGIEIDDQEKNDCNKSFDHSKNEMTKIIQYIIGTDTRKGLQPHEVIKTKCVNDARQTIILLNKPLVDIIRNNQANILKLKEHETKLAKEYDNFNKFKECINLPFIELDIKNLENAKTVCSSKTCCERILVAGQTKINYTKTCHLDCDCTFSGLIEYFCSSISWKGTCKTCNCSWKKHLHIYYEITPIERKILNEEVQNSCKTQELILIESQTTIKELRERVLKIEEEIRIITVATAQFSWYLKNNSMWLFNDKFEEYLGQSIESAKEFEDTQNVQKLELFLQKYQDQKKLFENLISDTEETPEATTEDVYKNIEKIKNLEINGKTVRDAINVTQSVARKMLNSIFYLHDSSTSFCKSISKSFSEPK